MTSKFLRLRASRIGYEQLTVILQHQILDFSLRRLVHVFLIEGYDSSGDCLADGIDLTDAASTLDLHANINFAKFLLADEQNRFHYLCT